VTYPVLKGGVLGEVWPFLSGTILIILSGVMAAITRWPCGFGGYLLQYILLCVLEYLKVSLPPTALAHLHIEKRVLQATFYKGITAKNYEKN